MTTQTNLKSSLLGEAEHHIETLEKELSDFKRELLETKKVAYRLAFALDVVHSTNPYQIAQEALEDYARLTMPKPCICEDCKGLNAEQTFCPYALEVHGKHVEVKLCNECYTKRRREA